MLTYFFCCPVCGELLVGERTLTCSNGHSFDKSKYHYVNLLLSNRSAGKRHGDDNLMVRSRGEFLDKGYYGPVRQAVLDVLRACAVPGMRLLDAGCGECWYTAYFAAELSEFAPHVAGVDISKDALRWGAKRGGVELAVASTAHLPVADASCDAVLNIFSPPEIREFHRVLKPGGVLIRALPLEGHLWALKSAVYDTPYRNPSPETSLPGFVPLSRQDLRYSIHLDNQADIRSLFTMTPYYYKTGAADQAKLQALHNLGETVEIAVLAYQKITEPNNVSAS